MKIKNRPTFTAPVALDGLDAPITFRFRRLKLTERMTHVDAMRAALDALEAPPADGVAYGAMADVPTGDMVRRGLEIKTDFVMHFVDGWLDVEDAEFSRDSMFDLLDSYDDAYDKLMHAVRDAGAEAAKGNLSPSPASGPAAAAA